MMTSLSHAHIDCLESFLSQSAELSSASPAAIGDTIAGNGVWRFYSTSWPEGGLNAWNTSSGWKRSWRECLPDGFLAFGEDVFGNQLAVMPHETNTLLWNHEDGQCCELLLPVIELLRTIVDSGSDWIDFYSDGSADVARRFGSVPRNQHLHWRVPLILGGQVSDENVVLVDREPHLVGHASLWMQVRDLPPGSEIVVG